MAKAKEIAASKLSAPIGRMERQVATTERRSKAQAAAVAQAKEGWGATEAAIRRDVAGRLEACQGLLLSRAAHTHAALEVCTHMVLLICTKNGAE